MTRISWSDTTSRFFEAGVDRGVLYPKFKSAVPWNGLTSVQEGGGADTSVSYIDGRPFLIKPNRKEYTATISAITYPDEFSDVMGVEKIAAGLYFDSQQGDSFGLSYRTLIGNPQDGIDHGYKIHVVYNCVVIPEGIGYSTIGQDINPIEFSWQIQAVPEQIPGYHATAHIIIDTRELTPEVIFQVEELLYGGVTPTEFLMDGGTPGEPLPLIDADGGDSGVTPTEIADGGSPFMTADVVTMPTPEMLLDILSYGDDIIITDLGGGFWEAAGAYRNVHRTSDGLFEINNVDAIDHGDGTFTVTTTIH